MQDQRYRLEGVGRIPLWRRDGSIAAWATVDLEDALRVGRFRWSMHGEGYAFGCVGDGVRMLMHRFVLGLQIGDGVHTDHRDRNRLNNRRSNIRATTQAANNQNVRGQVGASSRYRGVSRVKRTGKWIAYCKANGHFYRLGYYTDEREAAQVAADFRRKHMPHNEEPDVL